jgi:hypothetical protein
MADPAAQGVIPHLVVGDAAAALDFYRKGSTGRASVPPR